MVTQNPLLTLPVLELLTAARDRRAATVQCSLDLQRTQSHIRVFDDHWQLEHAAFPYPKVIKPHTIYYWDGEEFRPATRYAGSLIKLVPTEWGAPTFEIDGIKMLPSAAESPFLDAQRKVAMIKARGKVVLDCCGGLGYFAAWCVQAQAADIKSYEKNPDVLWLRKLNPWSPAANPPLRLTQADILSAIQELPGASIDAALHDPPRFSIAGELYSLFFYQQLARVLKKRALLFHYTGGPNKVARGRELWREVSARLQTAGFESHPTADGVLATRL